MNDLVRWRQSRIMLGQPTPPGLDLNFLYGKLDTVYCKKSSNKGER